MLLRSRGSAYTAADLEQSDFLVNDDMNRLRNKRYYNLPFFFFIVCYTVELFLLIILK